MLFALLAVSGFASFDTYEVSIDVKDQFLAYSSVELSENAVLLTGRLEDPDTGKYIKDKMIKTRCVLDQKNKKATCTSSYSKITYTNDELELCQNVKKLPVVSPERRNRLPFLSDSGFPAPLINDRHEVFLQGAKICHYDGQTHYYVKYVDEETFDFCTLNDVEKCSRFANDVYFYNGYRSFVLTSDFKPVILYAAMDDKSEYVYKLAIQRN